MTIMEQRHGTIAVGTAKAEPGKITRGELLLGHFPDSPITSPVMIACGAKPGPVLWAQGCIHGPEIGGPVALQRVLNGIDLTTMSGTIVAVMLANPNGFREYSRNTPLDGENLNRIFPGAPAGPHSQQTAHYLFEAASAVADAMLDLHSGGDRSLVPFYALYRNDGSAAARKSHELAEAAGTPDIWASTDGWLKGAMFTNMTARGIPSLIIECGGGGGLPEAHVKSFETAITGIATALGILPGKAPRQGSYRVMDNALLVYSKLGGFFEPAVEAGEVVDEGQALGRLLNPYGDVIETVTSPIGRGWIGSIRKRYMPVYSGDQIAEVIAVLED
ncbi:succinylglutamate desuccinylase/aspartoacylase domain-containing protein [Oceanibacterium hippocampi]|uniref:succinylglutamate desuccinylase/aspartoacylase domain-containing protein n=1 Tax=Oceanibacterium hippocampi TaxID=745714 RepID=UPI000A2712AF|nr:succinylglutamate desuccinylase/aspartoacylase family protein [Oceanibacterium hippocampi]